MRWLQPTPPPYDPSEWVKLPLPERARAVCEAWALQGYGAPLAIYTLYVLKIGLYVGGWAFFCGFTPGLDSLANIADWWLAPVAFQKAILWSLLFEALGLGCGSGPLTGRYFPPIGGVLYFLRPGTTKLPLWPALPLLGGARRTWLDVALYAALLGTLLRALVAPAIDAPLLLPIAVLLPVLALCDRTIFLACRAEHYWTTVMCFLLVGDWIAAAKAVQIALWFWAGVSKLNHHFPAVVCVMTSNSPFTWPGLRRLMYRNYPDDLRPSRLAGVAAHVGTAFEIGVPIVLLFAPGGTSLVIGLVLMVMLHAFITSNVPMGVPIEWNVMVVYGGFALFWAHPEARAFDVGSVPLALLLLVMLVGLPLLGNLFPGRLSFLMAMRYYAGNWAYSVWLFRDDSARKLDRLNKAIPLMRDQLKRMIDDPDAIELACMMTPAFRLIHLQGRVLHGLVPRAVDDIDRYEWMDGEMVAGMVLGWNFGDGHLHGLQLLDAIRDECGFEPGELRLIIVESQPLGGASMAWTIADAADGVLETGATRIADVAELQPWPTGVDAAAFRGVRAG